mmetsp:Transcript_22919/g.65830  ORF Transcript_22919/g.65830 Transcript_22919/m.65830 type:complete len:229 (-) Transcript_22919:341-1027(-)
MHEGAHRPFEWRRELRLRVQGDLRGGRGVPVVPRRPYSLPQRDLRRLHHRLGLEDVGQGRPRGEAGRPARGRGLVEVCPQLLVADRGPVRGQADQAGRPEGWLGLLRIGACAVRLQRGGADEVLAGEQSGHLPIRHEWREKLGGVLRGARRRRGQPHPFGRRPHYPRRGRGPPPADEGERRSARAGFRDARRRTAQGCEEIAGGEEAFRREPVLGRSSHFERYSEDQR